LQQKIKRRHCSDFEKISLKSLKKSFLNFICLAHLESKFIDFQLLFK